MKDSVNQTAIFNLIPSFGGVDQMLLGTEISLSRLEGGVPVVCGLDRQLPPGGQPHIDRNRSELPSFQGYPPRAHGRLSISRLYSIPETHAVECLLDTGARLFHAAHLDLGLKHGCDAVKRCGRRNWPSSKLRGRASVRLIVILNKP